MTTNLLTVAPTSMMPSYLMLGGMLLLMYFVLFLPQKKQQKRDASMRANIDIGDEVLTQGGIVGRVVSIKEDTLIIETGSDRVKIRFIRNAIIRNNTEKEVVVEKKKKK